MTFFKLLAILCTAVVLTAAIFGCTQHKVMQATFQDELQQLLPGKKLRYFNADSISIRSLDEQFYDIRFDITGLVNDTLVADRYAYFPVLASHYPVQFFSVPSDSALRLNLLTASSMSNKNYYIATIPWADIDSSFYSDTTRGVRFRLRYIFKLDNREGDLLHLPFNFADNQSRITVRTTPGRKLATAVLNADRADSIIALTRLPASVSTDSGELYEGNYKYRSGDVVAVRLKPAKLPVSIVRLLKVFSMIAIYFLLIYLAYVWFFNRYTRVRIQEYKKRLREIEKLKVSPEVAAPEEMEPPVIDIWVENKASHPKVSKEASQPAPLKVMQAFKKSMHLETQLSELHRLETSYKTRISHHYMRVLIIVFLSLLVLLISLTSGAQSNSRHARRIPQRPVKPVEELIMDDLTIDISPAFNEKDALDLGVNLAFFLTKPADVRPKELVNVEIDGPGGRARKDEIVQDPSDVLIGIDFLRWGHIFKFNHTPNNDMPADIYELACDMQSNYALTSEYEKILTPAKFIIRADIPIHAVRYEHHSMITRQFLWLTPGRDRSFPLDSFSVIIPFQFNKTALLRSISMKKIEGFETDVYLTDLPDLGIEEAPDRFVSENGTRYKIEKQKYFALHVTWRRSFYYRRGLFILLSVISVLPFLIIGVKWLRNRILKVVPKIMGFGGYIGIFTFIIKEYKINVRTLLDSDRIFNLADTVVIIAAIISFIGIVWAAFIMPANKE